MRHVFKAYKLLTTLFFALIILGLVLSTNIQNNALIVFKTLNSEGVIGVITGILLGFFALVIFWFAPKTLLKLFSTKGKLREFWNEI